MSGPKHNVNPADHGWTYQGSNAQSRVEYWQNDQGAKMDYYPTTGTVTVLRGPSFMLFGFFSSASSPMLWTMKVVYNCTVPACQLSSHRVHAEPPLGSWPLSSLLQHTPLVSAQKDDRVATANQLSVQLISRSATIAVAQGLSRHPWTTQALARPRCSAVIWTTANLHRS